MIQSIPQMQAHRLLGTQVALITQSGRISGTFIAQNQPHTCVSGDIPPLAGAVSGSRAALISPPVVGV